MERKQTHIMYGFITAVAMIIVNLILYISGVGFEPWAQYVGYIPFLIGLILNGMAYSKANDGLVKFGNVFGSCFKSCAIITLCVLVWSFIAIMIFPEMKEKGMEIARESMAKRGMSDEKIEQGIEMTKKYFSLFMAMGIVFGYMFYGAIFSLISAAIAKKDNSSPTVQM
jgi:hypothetical protein